LFTRALRFPALRATPNLTKRFLSVKPKLLPSFRSSKKLWLAAGLTTVGITTLVLSRQEVDAEDKDKDKDERLIFSMDLSVQGIERMLNSYQRHRTIENAMATFAFVSLVLGDMFLVTGTGLGGAALGVTLALVHVYQCLEPVLPNAQKKSALHRNRYMDISPEMVLMLSMLSAYQLKEENAFLNRDGFECARLKRIAERIVQASGVKLPSGQQWEYNVIQSEEMNAFVLQSGQIFVYSGLMDEFNDDELSFILSHEVAHVEAKHVAERLSLQRFPEILRWSYFLLSFFGVFVLDPINTGGIDLVSTLVFSLPFSRMHEQEADLIGLDYLVKADISPDVCIQVCDRFVEIEREKSGAKHDLSRSQKQARDLIHTHPCWDFRKEALQIELPAKMLEYERRNIRK